MNNNARPKIAAYVVTLAWSLALLIAGVQLDGVVAKALSFLPTVIVVGFACFDRWIWRLKSLRNVFHRPLLDGTWRGELISMRPGDDGAEITYDPIRVYQSIRQTFTSINITQLSSESKSRSTVAELKKHEAGDYTVYYQYSNQPDLAVRDRSPLHAGGSELRVSSTSPKTLSGEYWTNRRTRGTYKLERVSDTHYAEWAEADTALGGGEED